MAFKLKEKNPIENEKQNFELYASLISNLPNNLGNGREV